MSTKIFPWRLIQQHFPILKETFQYPRRISVLFIPLILIALGITANEIVKKDNREISVGVIVLFSIFK
ncbi:MAG: hypothetical protein L0G48_07300 [Staphylococcus equorum]|nr:hypothetical protein [Staphylococcus equorum]